MRVNNVTRRGTPGMDKLSKSFTSSDVFDVFLPTSSRIFKVSIFQLRHSPFFTWFVMSLPRSHRLSSHSRLNAFVIQTKLNLTLKALTCECQWC
jgi:hypothetical protein